MTIVRVGPPVASLSLSIAAALTASCGGRATSNNPVVGPSTDTWHFTEGQAKRWVQLQIGRVEVQPNRIDGTPWDGDERSGGSACGVLGMLGKSAAGPVGGAVATWLCETSGGKQAQREPRAPDLFVRVTAGALTFRTPVAVNTSDEVFDFPIALPLDGVGPDGLIIDVVDQDEELGTGETIGRMRIQSSSLRAVTRQSPPVFRLADRRVTEVEVTVLPYRPRKRSASVRFDVASSPVASAIEVAPGELVTIRSRGSYSVANDERVLSPRGYLDGDKRNYNVEGLEQVNHGAAIAFIGDQAATHSTLVVDECVSVITVVPGQIMVGVNDSDRDNNKGALEFSVDVRLPSLEEWRSNRRSRCPLRE